MTHTTPVTAFQTSGVWSAIHRPLETQPVKTVSVGCERCLRWGALKCVVMFGKRRLDFGHRFWIKRILQYVKSRLEYILDLYACVFLDTFWKHFVHITLRVFLDTICQHFVHITHNTYLLERVSGYFAVCIEFRTHWGRYAVCYLLNAHAISKLGSEARQPVNLSFWCTAAEICV